MKALIIFSILLCATLVACDVHYRPKIPGWEANNVTQYSGYITINEQYNANIFYWFFESQNEPSTDPVVMWMTGGPGCSSEVALFFENGPYHVSSNLQLSSNPYSWNTYANLLYIDQPVGTGFSYADQDYVHNETMVAQEMYQFLQGWFGKYDQYLSNDFYIIGESYGGHYVPAVSAGVVLGNANPSNTYINLRGIGIGNGWTDPIVQYGAYGPFSYANGLLTSHQYAEVNSTFDTCYRYLSAGDLDRAYDYCSGVMETVLEYNPGLNYYNIDTKCVGSLCYNLNNITNYLNQKSVQNQLGVKPTDWTACNTEVYELFGVDFVEPYQEDIPTVLASEARVLIYNGMLDLICNYYGGAAWTDAMTWTGQSDFNDATLADWTLNGTTVGHWKSAQNFTFMEVEGAGHMVPHDQPQVALAMLEIFLNAREWQ